MPSRWLLPLLAAPFVGSFLGVLVMRLPENRPVIWARSGCVSCGAVLGPRDLVPLFSYAVSAGRCRHCRAPIGRAHPAIELAALAQALLVVAIAAARPDLPLLWTWSGCVLGWTLLALAWIDWRCTRLPDVLTLPLLMLGLAACSQLEPERLADHAAASIVAYAGFRGIAWSYRRLRGRDGLGTGDAKLLAAGGAWAGLAALPLMVLLGALATLIIAAIRDRGRLQPATRIPFGPGLAASTWLLWLHGAAPASGLAG